MSAQRVASALLAVFVAFSIASPAEEKIGIPPTRVVVVKLGLGTGTVTSVPAGIDCGAVCEAMFPSPSLVTLTATPSVDSSFGGWGRRGCSGTTCAVYAGSGGSVTATFHLATDSDGDGIPNAVEPAEGRDPQVKDNDVFADDRLFTMQQYRDFLGREGDPAGIQGWGSLIGSGAYSRPQVIDAFLRSPEFYTIVPPVVRLYFATYLRAPDYGGLVFNVGLVKSGAVTLAQLADFFAQSPEFLALYGALDDAQFVTLLYGNVLGREPDAAGLAGWVSFLGSGGTRGQVLLGFSESVEYKPAIDNEVVVTALYAGMLRRTADSAGFGGWVSFLDTGAYTREQVIGSFFLSTEYHDRVLRTRKTLTVNGSSTGRGTVTSVPAGIDCGTDCTEAYEHGTVVTLTAMPSPGATFTGWRWVCSGTGPCVVTMDDDLSVIADFTINLYPLTVTLTGSGSGKVTTDLQTIVCPTVCTGNFSYGYVITLTATPDTGSTFGGWSGACSGTGACVLTMDAAKSVTASFTN